MGYAVLMACKCCDQKVLIFMVLKIKKITMYHNKDEENKKTSCKRR